MPAMNLKAAAMILGMSTLLAACGAKRPVFYPNEHLNRVGQAQAEADINECMALAEQYVKGGMGKQVARDTAVGAGTGAAVGGVVGAIEGNAGTRAAQGAAGGATAVLVSNLFRSREPSPMEVNYVNTCLAERGYRVLGWE
jgi:predicted small lipoprotein YifL